MATTRHRLSLGQLPFGLMLGVISVALLGAYNLHSAAAAHAPRLFVTQLSWFALGWVLVAASLLVDYRVSEQLAYAMYAVVVGLLILVLGVGRSTMGAQRWLQLGALRFQPSELAKLAVIVGMARYFGRRLPAGGWTISALLRPLNPSRPLACVVSLAWCWRRPGLADPVGELARRVHQQLGDAPPQVGDLLWMRGCLVAGVVMGSVALAWGILVVERRAALLAPWPPQRRQRLWAGVVVLAAAAALALAAFWQAPALRDPVGCLLAHLYARAADGGDLFELRPQLLLRGALAAMAVVYLMAALWLRPPPGHDWVDRWVAPIDVWAVPAVLVLAQPDLGTAGIIVLIGLTMTVVVGVRTRSLLISGLMSTWLSALAWFAVLKDYQKRRILTFIDPEQDLQGAGWNAVQSIIAVGSGQWAGKGHRGGSQTQLSFLPEQHTDFAFSVWAEEQGFFGSVSLLLLYGAILAAAFGVARGARDTYGALLATGVAAMILWQVIINVSMVIGVLPVVGITLPLFSYGGSSTLAVMLAVGLLINVHWRRRA